MPRYQSYDHADPTADRAIGAISRSYQNRNKIEIHREQTNEDIVTFYKNRIRNAERRERCSVLVQALGSFAAEDGTADWKGVFPDHSIEVSGIAHYAERFFVAAEGPVHDVLMNWYNQRVADLRSGFKNPPIRPVGVFCVHRNYR